MINPKTMPNPTTKTAKIVEVQTSKFQHRSSNTDSTLKCPKPPKTPKIPNRQKSFVNEVKKTKTPKNPRQPKISARQKFPTNKNFRNNKTKIL
jgi:hypothetical protein